jgi:hypothetical protein
MEKIKMTEAQMNHFANVRDILHIHGHNVPRTDWQIIDGEKNPVFKIDNRTYKTYAGFIRAANKIAWDLM